MFRIVGFVASALLICWWSALGFKLAVALGFGAFATAFAAGLLAAGLSAWLFFRRTRLEASRNALLVLASCMLAVYALEAAFQLGLALDEPMQPHQKAALAAGRLFDARSKYEVMRDLRARGEDAVIAFNSFSLLEPGANATVAPLGHIANVATVLCNEGGEYAVYTTDERGFRNPPGLWSQAPIDALCLGDSFTEGACVPDGQGFADAIRRAWPRTVALGVTSAGPLYQLALLKEYIGALKPRVVLWCYYEGNDLFDLEREASLGEGSILDRCLTSNRTQRLPDRQGEIDVALRELLGSRLEEMERAATAKHAAAKSDAGLAVYLANGLLLRETRERVRLARVGYNEARRLRDKTDDLALMAKVLGEAKAVAERHGARLYFVRLPAWIRFKAPDGPETQGLRSEQVLATAREAGLPVIDALEAFARHGDPLDLFPFRIEGHYNAKGHEAAGKHIVEALRAEGW